MSTAEPSNLLVIDDEPSLRRTMRTALESMGHHVAEASSGGRQWRRCAGSGSIWRSSTFGSAPKKAWTFFRSCCKHQRICMW